MCDTTILALEMCTMDYGKFKDVFRSYQRHRTRGDALYHQPLSCEFDVIIKAKERKPRTIQVKRVFSLCRSGWRCPSCIHSIRHYRHREATELSTEISLTEDLLDVKRAEAVPKVLNPPVNNVADVYSDQYYIRKSSYHFCGNWCGINYSLPDTPWLSNPR